MTVTPNDPIIGPPRGSVAQCLAYAYELALCQLDVEAYIREVYRLAPLIQIDPLIIVGQACHETNKFTSSWWFNRLNPAGIGITGDPAQNEASQTWANGTDAARAHVAHMIAYTYDTLPKRPETGMNTWLGDNGRNEAYLGTPPLWVCDERFYHAANVTGGKAKTISDLAGTWAMDPDYAAGIVAHANRILATKGAPSPMALYSVVGLPGPGIELPVPLSHDIISTSQTNQRPGIARETPGYWVQHETANPNLGADAAMHNRWLHGGAGGAQLSFHFAVDDGAIYQMIPIDEVTWQAADGAGPGNMSGVSCELCVNAGIDTAKARHNAEALAGGILKALGMGSDRVKRHFDFNQGDPNRHHCPDTMMSEGYWPTFVANTAAIIGGKPPASYPPASLPDWWSAEALLDGKDRAVNGTTWYFARREYEVIKATARLQLGDKGSPKIGPSLQPRETFTGVYRFKSANDGRDYVVSAGGTRIWAAKLTPAVTVRPR